MIEKQEAEIKEYMQEVKGLLRMYVPPDPQKMEQAKQASNFSVNPAGSIVNLVFTNATLSKFVPMRVAADQGRRPA